MTGRIIKGIGGFYSVMTQAGIITVKARGKFRIEDITPMIGDMVETDGETMLKILPRKNSLIRPPIANVDCMALTLSASKPAPDLLLADKLLYQATFAGIDAFICVNKADLGDGGFAEQFINAGCDIIMASAMTGQGIEELKARLHGCTIFAGQSGVGKTSLINAILPESELETGEISERIGRGRHTTRHSELIPLNGGVVVDTPGFSVFDSSLFDAPPDRWYKEIDDKRQGCQFSGCEHRTEPGCAVKEAVEQGLIHKERYSRYLRLLDEHKESRRKIYD
ncbi:MAG: ribosome small subunit-dependent GTPase A [Christensenellales bacterium]|jgi:ribosome biogenesis GTPase